jgi:hypothetical protein
MNTCLPVMMRARAVFYRERFSRMYGPEVYGLAHLLVEIPWIAFIIVSVTAVLYFMVGFAPTAGQFFFYTFTLFLLTIKMLSLGQFAAACLPTPEVAQGVIGGVGACACGRGCGERRYARARWHGAGLSAVGGSTRSGPSWVDCRRATQPMCRRSPLPPPTPLLQFR